ncbi:MAG: ABC transporter permease, partial [Acidobacteriota bacterium]
MTPVTSPAPRSAIVSRPRLSLTIGACLVGAFFLCALFAPLFTAWFGHDPYDQVAPRTVTPPTPPGRDNLLGTDGLGRDILSRLVHGARISLEVGVVA